MKKYEILYRDEDLCVIHKRAGLAVQSARASVPDLMSMLRNDLLEEGMKKPYLGLVNRLDQPVEGILLVAFNEKAAADLSRQVADHIHMEKWYQALVCGKPSAKSGTLVDYLLKDARNNLSKVVPEGTRGSKRSELTYEVLESWEGQTLLKIRLLTGRHHQIRVQLSHAGMPIVGDAKYGKGGGQLCLCSFKTSCRHPRTGRQMTYEVKPEFPVPPTAL